MSFSHSHISHILVTTIKGSITQVIKQVIFCHTFQSHVYTYFFTKVVMNKVLVQFSTQINVSLCKMDQPIQEFDFSIHTFHSSNRIARKNPNFKKFTKQYPTEFHSIHSEQSTEVEEILSKFMSCARLKNGIAIFRKILPLPIRICQY